MITVLLTCGALASTPASPEAMSPEKLVKIGKAYADRGDDDKAIGVLEQALKAKPDAAEAHHVLGRCYARKEKLDLAVKHLERAVELEPKRYEAWLLLGMTRDLVQDHAAAAQAFRKAVEAAPDRPEAHRELGSSLLLMGKADEAVQELSRASKLWLSDVPQERAELDGELGHALVAAKRCAEAEPLLARSAAALPESADTRVHLGDARACLKRADEAEADFLAAIRIDKGHVRAWHHLGLVRLVRGDRDGAKKALDEAARLAPADAAIRAAVQRVNTAGKRP